jgi:hypothetical protein
MSELELEQRTNIKFLVQLGKSGSEIRKMLMQVYMDNVMKKTAVYKWTTHFSGGGESITDEGRSRRPATGRTEENTANVPQIVCGNRRLSEAQQRKRTSTDLDMWKVRVCANMVPKELTEEHCL